MTTPAPGLPELLAALDAGETIPGDSALHHVMHNVSQDALRIAAELNGSYHEPDRVRELIAQLTDKPVDETVTVFPPFQAVIATLNHGLDPAHRADLIPAPVVIGRNVWIGANATILPGITIGDNAVIAAASVVTKDVPANTVVVGSPARPVKRV